MTFNDYFLKQLAVDPATGAIVPNATFSVYAKDDTSFSTPLTITDLSGTPMTLTSGPTGITPEFKCPGRRQVVARTADGLVTPLYSLGIAFEIMPDPTAQPSMLTIATDGSGSYILTPLPGAGVGIRDVQTFTTGSLAASARQLGVFALASTLLVLRVQVDRYCRVRLYDTTAHRDADATRALGVDPDPLSNTGVLMDMELDPADGPWTLTPPAPVGSFTGSTDVPITVDNLDSVAGTVGVTFTFVTLEG